MNKVYILVAIVFFILGFGGLYFFNSPKGVHLDTVYTEAKIDTLKRNFGRISIRDTVYNKFTIQNTGYNPLLIKLVQTDCGCSVAYWDNKPILPGQKTQVVIRVIPLELGYFNKMITVFCNIKKSPFYLRIMGEVVEK